MQACSFIYRKYSWFKSQSQYWSEKIQMDIILKSCYCRSLSYLTYCNPHRSSQIKVHHAENTQTNPTKKCISSTASSCPPFLSFIEFHVLWPLWRQQNVEIHQFFHIVLISISIWKYHGHFTITRVSCHTEMRVTDERGSKEKLTIPSHQKQAASVCANVLSCRTV